MTDIVKYPDVFLRMVSSPVKFPLDDKTERLIKWMIKIMYKNYGIGLAAVQVGYQRRIFVMDCTRSGNNPQVFINPEIHKKSKESMIDFEGCLSAPGKKGEEKTKTFYNLAARCIQHELDHLDGKLCIDYEKGEYSRDKHKSQTMVEFDFRAKSDT